MTSHKEVEEWAAMIAQMEDDPSFHPTYNKKGVRATAQQEKAQQDLVDHIKAGQQDQKHPTYNKLVKILTEENEALKKNRSLNTMDEIAYRELEQKYEKEHKLRQEAEGETTIVKGIGQNSPEMKEARAEIERLKFKNEKLHQHNEKITKEIRELHRDNKKLAHEVEDRVDRLRKSGL